MNQTLSTLTGCSAGATESFVVVPFELVKIKCVIKLCLKSMHALMSTLPDCRIRIVLMLDQWTLFAVSSGMRVFWACIREWKLLSGGISDRLSNDGGKYLTAMLPVSLRLRKILVSP